MFDTVLGLPVHVLVIHVVVVLGPIAALMAIAYAARPQWHRVLAWPTTVAAVVAGISATVAASSGEELEHRLEAQGEHNPLLHQHTEAGDLARAVVLAFMVIAVAAIFWLMRPERPAAVRTATRVLLVLASVAALVAVVRAGHTGAQVAWSDVVA